MKSQAQRHRLRTVLALSSLYVVWAVWVWVTASGQIETSADTVVIPNSQTVSLLSTYSSQQQDCVRSSLGNARFNELLGAAPAALTDAESASISSCLAAAPTPQEN